MSGRNMTLSTNYVKHLNTLKKFRDATVELRDKAQGDDRSFYEGALEGYNMSIASFIKVLE